MRRGWHNWGGSCTGFLPDSITWEFISGGRWCAPFFFLECYIRRSFVVVCKTAPWSLLYLLFSGFLTEDPAFCRWIRCLRWEGLHLPTSGGNVNKRDLGIVFAFAVNCYIIPLSFFAFNDVTACRTRTYVTREVFVTEFPRGLSPPSIRGNLGEKRPKVSFKSFFFDNESDESAFPLPRINPTPVYHPLLCERKKTLNDFLVMMLRLFKLSVGQHWEKNYPKKYCLLDAHFLRS